MQIQHPVASLCKTYLSHFVHPVVLRGLTSVRLYVLFRIWGVSGRVSGVCVLVKKNSLKGVRYSAV